MQTTAGIDDLDIALIDPDQTWQESIQEYERFREFEQDITMPFTAPGAYLVTCSEENVAAGDTGYEATTLVLITDLDIIVKSTKQDLLVFAQNMSTGDVYPGVTLLLSDGAKIFTEKRTGEDGVFHAPFEELKDLPDLRVFAFDGKHYAAKYPGYQPITVCCRVAVTRAISTLTDRPIVRGRRSTSEALYARLMNREC